MKMTPQDRFRVHNAVQAAIYALEQEKYADFEHYMAYANGLYSRAVLPQTSPPAPRGGAAPGPLDAEVCLGLAQAA